jgi:hypothetical protein
MARDMLSLFPAMRDRESRGAGAIIKSGSAEALRRCPEGLIFNVSPNISYSRALHLLAKSFFFHSASLSSGPWRQFYGIWA